MEFLTGVSPNPTGRTENTPPATTSQTEDPLISDDPEPAAPAQASVHVAANPATDLSGTLRPDATPPKFDLASLAKMEAEIASADAKGKDPERAGPLNSSTPSATGKDDDAAIAALKSQLAALQGLLSTMQPSPGAKAIPPTAVSDKDAGNDVAAEQLAQAQSMADAAIAQQPATTTDNATTASPTTSKGGKHHSLENFNNRALGPDGSDQTHHSMDSLF